MNITQCKEAIMLCRAACFLHEHDGMGNLYPLMITPFIHGHAGVGKSALVRQTCTDNRLGFIDFRASQIEASDLRGLPDRALNDKGRAVRTQYLPPTDMPYGHLKSKVNETGEKVNIKCPACDPEMDIDEFNHKCGGMKAAQPQYCKGVLFADEVPRAEDDVIQSLFQLVIDRAVGQYEFPSGWNMVAAGNYLEGYQQNGFTDPAWISRFSHMSLSPDDAYMQQWSDYMRPFGTTADKIIQFVGLNKNHLLGSGIKGEMGFTVQPTPRTWEMTARIHVTAGLHGTFSRDIVNAVCTGLIGMELALQFDQFNLEITPNDIIEYGVEDRNTKKLNELNRNQLVGLVWGTASYAKDMNKTEKRMDNVLDFMGWIASSKSTNARDGRDLAVALGRQLMEGEGKKIAGALLSNPKLAQLAGGIKAVKGNKESWIGRMNARPELQKLMSRVSYGKTESN